jgi:hypothetical protein
VNGEGLSDLQKPDELEPVQPLGSRLVGVNLRKSCVDGWLGNDEAVDVREPKEPRTPCIIMTTEESIIPESPSLRM